MSGESIFKNLRLVTLAGEKPDTTVFDNYLVVIKNGVFTYVGLVDDYQGNQSGAINMEGSLCLPGLVACHNPALWLGEPGDVTGLTGDEYRALVKKITTTTAAANEETMFAILNERTEALARTGVTTCEIKSGFGGSPREELRLAQILRRFSKQTLMRTTVTFAIGHQFPEGADQDEILEQIEREIVSATYETDCADAVEVFCDDEGALDLDACSTILELYYKKKMPSRVSCDRFSDSAGATLPASFYSRCATYLNKTEELDLESLAKVGTVSVIVPEIQEVDLDQTLPDIDAIRSAGGCFALAPESGPGGLGKVDMLEVLRMGRRNLDLSIEETLAAGTIHAASALGLQDQAGVIAVGRPADMSFFNARTIESLFDCNDTRCVAVIRSGHLTLIPKRGNF